MKPSLEGLSAEEKRALLGELLRRPLEFGPTLSAQQAVVLYQMLLPDSVVWNSRSTLRFTSKRLDAEEIRGTLQAILDRHPALRTTYEFANTLLCQRVHSGKRMAFDSVDARQWSPAQVRARLLADAHRPFDIYDGPMFRARLFQREADDILQLEAHHSVCDLWSLEVILAELDDPRPRPPDPGFMAFIAWQLAWLKSPRGLQAAAWWGQALQDAAPMALRGAEAGEEAAFITFRIDPAPYRQAARAHGVTLFNVLLSALQVGLGQWCGQDDVCIGVPAANRPERRFEPSVGFFANLLLYRQRLAAGLTWAGLWERNRDFISGALEHQSYPVMQATSPPPRTDVLLQYQQYQQARWTDHPPGEPDALGLRSAGLVETARGLREILYVEQSTLEWPVCFEILERQDRLEGILRYRTGCIDADRARTLVDGFIERLQASVRAPSGLLGDLR